MFVGGVYLKLRCDRCQQEDYVEAKIEKGRKAEINMYFVSLDVFVNVESDSGWHMVDNLRVLCPECYEKFQNWISGGEG